MTNIIRDQKTFKHAVCNYTISNYFGWMNSNSLILNPEYQREYVWTENEQQAFLKTLISGFPIGHVSIVETIDTQFEVVDGKQRLTTLQKFYQDEIPLIINGEKYFYSKLDKSEQRVFGNIGLPAIMLAVDNEKEKVQYFSDVNFSGVPQSEEHKQKIKEMLETM